MNKQLQRLDMLARQAGLAGISALMFGGQFAPDGKWHYTDCKVIGTATNPLGPFPSEMVVPAMITSCCQNDTWAIIQEVSPAALGHTLNALLVIDDARQIVAMYATDFSSTPFADLAPLDAIADFSSELAELSGNVSNRVLRVTHRLEAVIEHATKFDEDLAALRLQRFTNPEFIDDLFEVISKELGVVRDDTPVLTSCSSFSVQYSEDPMKNYILTGLIDVYAPEAASSRCLASMPLWVYRSLAQVGGSDWLTKPHCDLDHAVEETARVLWINNPNSPMFNFDSCVLAATALCKEPTSA
jgi:hypothetical protein